MATESVPASALRSRLECPPQGSLVVRHLAVARDEDVVGEHVQQTARAAPLVEAGIRLACQLESAPADEHARHRRRAQPRSKPERTGSHCRRRQAEIVGPRCGNRARSGDGAVGVRGLSQSVQPPLGDRTRPAQQHHISGSGDRARVRERGRPEDIPSGVSRSVPVDHDRNVGRCVLEQARRFHLRRGAYDDRAPPGADAGRRRDPGPGHGRIITAPVRSARVRVLVLAEYYPRAGDPVLGVWAHRQALAARDAGADVRVLVLHRPIPPASSLRAGELSRAVAPLRQPAHVELDGLSVRYARYFSPPRPWSYSTWGAWAAPAVRRELAERPVDLIHAHYPVPAGDAARRAWPTTPLVLSVHSHDPLGGGGAAGHRTLAAARVVLANSAGTASRCAAAGARNVRVVHLGTDLPAGRSHGPRRPAETGHGRAPVRS